MDVVVIFCPVCWKQGVYCPACLFIPVVHVPIKKAPRLNFEIKRPEDAPERLIEVVQNLAGNVPQEVRERAAVDLIKRFQYLIQRVTNSLYYGYRLGKEYNYDYADFSQDVLTEFCDLVLNDFKIKDNPLGHDDSGFAPFGAYIKTKLYRRAQWKMEQRLGKLGWKNKDGERYNKERSVDYNTFLESPSGGTVMETAASDKFFFHEIQESILANSLGCEEIVFQNIQDEKLKEILAELIDISKDEKIIPGRDGEIWRMVYLSGLIMEEIGQKIVEISPDVLRTIGKSRVRQIAKQTNTRIVAEYGKRAAMRISGLKG